MSSSKRVPDPVCSRKGTVVRRCIACGGDPSVPPARNSSHVESENYPRCVRHMYVTCIVCGGKGYILSGTICIDCGEPLTIYQHCYSCAGTGKVPHLCLSL